MADRKGPDKFRVWQRVFHAREPLSTWAEFAKLTGLELPGFCIVAKPVRRKREPTEHRARHG